MFGLCTSTNTTLDIHSPAREEVTRSRASYVTPHELSEHINQGSDRPPESGISVRPCANVVGEIYRALPLVKLIAQAFVSE